MAHNQIVDSADLADYSGAQWEMRVSQKSAYNSTHLACLSAGPEDDPAYSSRPWLQVRFTGRSFALVGRPTRRLRLNYTLTSQGLGEEGEMREADVDFEGSRLIGKVSEALLTC